MYEKPPYLSRQAVRGCWVRMSDDEQQMIATRLARNERRAQSILLSRSGGRPAFTVRTRSSDEMRSAPSSILAAFIIYLTSRHRTSKLIYISTGIYGYQVRQERDKRVPWIMDLSGCP